MIWKNLWAALRDVFLYWVEQGVKIFRVDNPHTKPFDFWEWTIGEIKKKHPEVLFLAEAFTRPKVMHRLAKGGFLPNPIPIIPGAIQKRNCSNT